MFLRILLFTLTIYTLCAKGDTYKWVKTLPNPWELSEKELNKILPNFHKYYPNFHDRLIALNLWRVGTPYGIFCLGEERGIDPDPIIRVDTSDCTVHVLTTLAFAESQSFKDARNTMINIHYKPDQYGNREPTYKSWWHFTSNRLLNNPRTPDITFKIVSPDILETIQIELNKKQDGTQFLKLDWTFKESISFIPIHKLDDEILARLPDICGVAFVKRSYFKNGIVIAHEGFIINKTNLIHASLNEKMTVNINLLSYLFNNDKPRFDGVMFYEFKEAE